MFKTSTIIKWISVIVVVFAMVSTAAIASAAEKKIVIKISNDFSVKMYAYFWCYNMTGPGDNAKCLTKNTIDYIDPGKSQTWSYNYTKGMGCAKIVVSYGRADRSFQGSTKDLYVTFAENEHKMFKMVKTGSGDMDFVLQAIRGQFVK